MAKPKSATQRKCIYRVVTTEFYRVSYAVEAENHGDALAMFEILQASRALPKPERMLLGVIDPPEQIFDETGELVYSNAPAGDDAERMLFLEMWRRMVQSGPLGPAGRASVHFICGIKRWDVDEILKAIFMEVKPAAIVRQID